MINYLDAFDKHKRKLCRELTPRQQVETGYKTQRQVVQARRMIKRHEAYELFVSRLSPDLRDRIHMGEMAGAAGEPTDGSEASSVFGDDMSVFSEDSFNSFWEQFRGNTNAFQIDDSDSSDVEDQLSADEMVARYIRVQSNRLLNLHERGFMSPDELVQGLSELEGRAEEELQDVELQRARREAGQYPTDPPGRGGIISSPDTPVHETTFIPLPRV